MGLNKLLDGAEYPVIQSEVSKELLTECTKVAGGRMDINSKLPDDASRRKRKLNVESVGAEDRCSQKIGMSEYSIPGLKVNERAKRSAGSKLVGSHSVNDKYKELDIANDERDRQDNEAAELADFNPYEMEEFEKAYFPEYVECECDYTEARNSILGLWKRNPFKFLTLKKVFNMVQAKFRQDIERVYWFLTVRGHINVGLFSNSEMKTAMFRHLDHMKNSKKILILGAGAAGLAAGNQLHQFGYQVQVLEARNRLGGRVHTSESLGGSLIDFGASIITGLVGNPLDELFRQLSLVAYPIGENGVLYNRQSGEVVSTRLDSQVSEMFDQMLEAAVKQRSDSLETDRSLGLVLDELTGDLSQEKGYVLDWFYANLEYACATDLSALSNNCWDQDDVHEFAGNHLMLVNGYSAMIEPLARDLDVALNVEVKEVRYSEFGKKVVMMDQYGREYEGDAALVTLPLGVLKGGECRFKPELPVEKQMAIQKLGFGLLNKIIIRFEKVFWDKDVDWFGTVNQSSGRKERGHIYLFWNMQKFSQTPILVALCAGEAAHRIEERSDCELIQEVIRVLKKIYKLKRKPVAVSSAVTRWKSDQYSRGSYSYLAVGSTAQDYVALSMPINDHLFFAGEATNPYHPATVAGAYQSGLREARRIHQTFCPKEQNANCGVTFRKDSQRLAPKPRISKKRSKRVPQPNS
ncbi:uncharacterized protein LOC126313304 [Schistocerca gregaria]|uniref:uncharacterized protein LOC126313304 n=1 Tax=Schistocerca gregaria TaxID=7010 RepID=UPI00211DE51D|nr:uncharacterized protein LOC126313304 [Schistocerca gregaria]